MVKSEELKTSDNSSSSAEDDENEGQHERSYFEVIKCQKNIFRYVVGLCIFLAHYCYHYRRETPYKYIIINLFIIEDDYVRPWSSCQIIIQ